MAWCETIDPLEKLLTREDENQMWSLVDKLEIGGGYTESDVNTFRKFVNDIIEESSLEKRVTDAGLTIDKIDAKYHCIIQIALASFRYEPQSRIIIEVLMKEYDLDLTDDLMRKFFAKHPTAKMLEFFSEYIDLKRFPNEVRDLFENWCCHFIGIEDAEILEKIGFNVMDFANSMTNGEYHSTIYGRLFYNRYDKLLKYLFERGLDYKKFEKEILMDCIKYRMTESFKYLLTLGLDISSLRNFREQKKNSHEMKMYNLLEELDIDSVSIAMLLSEYAY